MKKRRHDDDFEDDDFGEDDPDEDNLDDIEDAFRFPWRQSGDFEELTNQGISYNELRLRGYSDDEIRRVIEFGTLDLG